MTNEKPWRLFVAIRSGLTKNGEKMNELLDEKIKKQVREAFAAPRADPILWYEREL
jgi:hypothetical protein